MSRREGRDSDLTRHRSRFDREPSPKRSRRDGKPASERVPGNKDRDTRDHPDRDQKNRRRLQDAVPLEALPAPDHKVETRALTKDSEKDHTHRNEESKKERNGHPEVTEHSSNPTEAPLSKSYFQHDERRHVGRNFGRGAATDHGSWRETKDRNKERAVEKPVTEDKRPRDEKLQSKVDINSFARPDKIREIDGDLPPPTRKRPAFREKKVPADTENVKRTTAEPEKEIRSGIAKERWDDNRRNHHHLDRSERPSTRDRIPNRGGEAQRHGLPSRERYVGNYGGRDKFSGRQGGYHGSGTKKETKWEHDLYAETSKSPPRQNEEEQIAKLEALLAS